MRICPKCEKENPSSANHCMFCGALLIDEEQLPEEIVLRRNLDVANETIEVLKKALAAMQEKAETGNETEVQYLNEQIENCNETIENLSNRIEKQSTTISFLNSQLDKEKKKKGGKWGIVFVVLFIIASSIAFQNYEDKQSFRSSYYYDESRIFELQSELETLRKEKESSSVSLNKLRAEYDELDNKYKEIVSQYPLIIDNILIGNTYRNGEVETEYGNTLYSYRLMCLSPKLLYRGYSKGNKTLKVKWFRPDGSLMTSPNSSMGFSQSSDYYIYEGSQSLIMSGWGNESMSYWPTGSYRVEVWFGNIMLKSKTFYVY